MSSSLILLPVWVIAQQAPVTPSGPAPVVITDHAPEGSASERQFRVEELKARPVTGALELLRAQPGLHLSAHGGVGKAHQLYFRGFDAVHGADIAVSVHGVPIGEVSNVHGQGYLDLYFLPPALVQGLRVSPGAWRLEAGPFAVAASADYEVGLGEEGAQLRYELGSELTAGASLSWRPVGGQAGELAWLDVGGGQGVGEGRSFTRARVVLGEAGSAGGWEWRALGFAYHGLFDSPGVRREDELLSGEVDLYGAYPNAGGGESSRALAIGQARRGEAQRALGATAWVGARDLTLRHNFTGFYYDAQRGDAREQTHQAATMGVQARSVGRAGLGSRELDWDAALGLQYDPLRQQDARIDPAGEIWAVDWRARGSQLEGYGWAGVGVAVLPSLRVVPGLRVEMLRLAVEPEVDVSAPGEVPAAAVSTAALPLARGSVQWSPAPNWAVFFNSGQGMRPPELRGISDGERAPVSLATTHELGASRQAEALGLRGGAFLTRSDNELVLDHAAGRFIAQGASRRVGGYLDATGQLAPGLEGELGITWADGRFVSSGEPIPFAPRWLSSAALRAGPAPVGHLPGGAPVRVSASAVGFLLGRRPLPSGFVSRRALVVDARVGLHLERGVIELAVDNVLGSEWRDGEFVYPSWFDTREARSELPVVHVTAGSPRVARLSWGMPF